MNYWSERNRATKSGWDSRITLTRLWLTEFIKLLAQNGISVKELDHPEMYHASTLPDCASTRGKPLHLIFKPAEEIRILRGAYNIGIVYWEFDKITTSSTTGNPSSNQFRMLSLLDEIWVANLHLKQILEAAGLRNIHYVPCPVETAEPRSNASRLQNWLGDTEASALQFNGGWPMTSMPLRDALPDDAGTDACPIFLSIFNPNDARKDFETLLRGFLAVRPTPGQQPTLLIKLIIENVESSLDEIHRNFRIWNAFGSAQHKNIVCFSKFITDQEMADLYRSCQYYLSVSRGEGQNLPLIEAIGYGCLAVSPNHTSMADYINPDTAIVVPSKLKRAPIRLRTRSVLPNFSGISRIRTR